MNRVLRLAFLFAATAGAALSAPPITKIEARSLPDKEVIERVLAELGEILVPPEAWPKGHKPTLPLNDLYYTTKPRATNVPGLCQTDEIALDFAPVSVEENGAKTKSKVVGISARPKFHFVTPPSAEISRAELSSADRRALGKLCAKLPRDANYFGATEVSDILDGVALLHAVQREAAIRANPRIFKCPGLNEGDCISAIKSIMPAALNSIDNCSSVDFDFEGRCLDVWGNNYSVAIWWKGSAAAPQLLKVRVGEIVTTGDYRAD